MERSDEWVLSETLAAVAPGTELRDALDQCEQDDNVRVVVLTGEGRAFSSGQDLTVDLKRDEQGRLDLDAFVTEEIALDDVEAAVGVLRRWRHYDG